jgi:hypothetical protein
MTIEIKTPQIPITIYSNEDQVRLDIASVLRGGGYLLCHVEVGIRDYEIQIPAELLRMSVIVYIKKNDQS